MVPPRAAPTSPLDALEPPAALPGDGILVGYSLEHEHRTAPIGFSYGSPETARPAGTGPRPTLDPILHTGGGHLLTIAPTGAGKGVGCIVPTLLRFPGPVIVIDPKGENVAVTAARRRALGQEVVVLDPLGITGSEDVGALNPLDLVDPDSDQAVDDSAALAALLGGGVEKEDPRNLFWYQRGEQLLTGVIQFVALERLPPNRSLAEVRRILNLPAEAFLELARGEMSECDDPEVRQVVGWLANPAEEMIGSILAMAQNSLGFLRGRQVHASTDRSTFDLAGVTEGDPLSIYLVIPPDKLESHRNLLRVWIGTLMSALMRRRAPVPHPTLLILDEAAQLGPLDQLRQAITLMRGYGLQTWSFWQDASQLRNLYPRDWETMVNNCRVHQAFGFTTLQGAETACALTGFHDPVEALQLDADEMILSISGDEAVLAQKPNYLADPAFQGLYSPNPFFTRVPGEPPTARRARRLYVRPTDAEGRAGDGAGPTPAPAVGGPDAAGDGPAAEPPGTTPEPGGDDDDPATIPLAEALGGLRLEDVEDEDEDEGPTWRESALEPLAHMTLPQPHEVPPLLDFFADHTEGTWNPATTRVRGLGLPYYGGSLLVEVADPLRRPTRTLGIKLGTRFSPFTPGSRGIGVLNRDVPLRLADETVESYLRFHLHFTRFGHPGLRLVESLEQLAYWTGATPGELAGFAGQFGPLAAVDGAGPGWTLDGAAIRDGRLTPMRFRVAPDGEVAVSDQGDGEPVPLPAGYPEVVAAGAGADASRRAALTHVHGPWLSVSAPERTSFAYDFGDGRVRPDAVLLRRSVACYPSADLLAVRRDDDEPFSFFFHRPGQTHPLGADTLWNSDRNPFGEGHLDLDRPGAAEAFLRMFTWYGGLQEDGWLLLDRFDSLPVRPGSLGLEAARSLWSQWSPVTALPVEPDEEASVVGRFRGMLLTDDALSAVRIAVRADGDVKVEETVEWPDPLDLDPVRKAALAAFPPLGRGGERGPEPGPSHPFLSSRGGGEGE